MKRLIFSLSFLTMTLVSQTLVNLGQQGKKVDFSSQPQTIPQRLVSTLPSGCIVGEQIYLTTATAGENLYSCTSSGIWTVNRAGATSPATQLTELEDFKVIRTNNTTLVVGQSCSAIKPCLAQNGATVTSVSAPVSISLQGTTNGSIYIYINESNNIEVGATAGLQIACSSPCQVVTNSTHFPPGSIPIFRWDSFNTAGQWDETGVDQRAFFRREVPQAAEGLISQRMGNIQRWSIDGTLIPRYFLQAGMPTGTCQSGRDMYTDMTSGNQFRCVDSEWVLSASKLWPINGEGKIQLNSTGIKPSCESANRFLIWATLGASGVKDSIEVCVKESDDTYSWATIY